MHNIVEEYEDGAVQYSAIYIIDILIYIYIYVMCIDMMLIYNYNYI